jgi:hypothetical protein
VGIGEFQTGYCVSGRGYVPVTKNFGVEVLTFIQTFNLGYEWVTGTCRVGPQITSYYLTRLCFRLRCGLFSP